MKRQRRRSPSVPIGSCKVYVPTAVIGILVAWPSFYEENLL